MFARKSFHSLLQNRTVFCINYPKQFHTSIFHRLFVQFFDTPNPASNKFIPGKQVLPPSISAKHYTSPLEAYDSPLAKALFKIDGVTDVYLAQDFFTVSIDTDNFAWDQVRPQIFFATTTHYQSGRPVIDENATPNKDTMINEEDDEVIIAIKEVLESHVRPLVQEDGGDVVFSRFEDGVVYLKLQGSCSTCPSSTQTLKMGIENMLIHYVPEVNRVEQETTILDKVNEQEFQKLEKNLGEKAA